MPSGPRVRTNNVFGTVTDNPLTAGATTLNSAGLADLAAVSSAHAVIVIDPLRAAGAPEIVVVTAHTASATSATVTRGAYGTTARQHAAGVLWVHAPTIDDVIRILTSSTRPSDPYRGQLIFETDTNSYVARDTSDAWQTAVMLGAWTAFTPTVKFGATTASIQNDSRYVRVGRLVVANLAFRLTNLNGGTGTLTATVPVPQRAITNPANSYMNPFGPGGLIDVSTGNTYTFQATTNTTADIVLRSNASPTVVLTHAAPITLAAGGSGTGDEIYATISYEAAS